MSANETVEEARPCVAGAGTRRGMRGELARLYKEGRRSMTRRRPLDGSGSRRTRRSDRPRRAPSRRQMPETTTDEAEGAGGRRAGGAATASERNPRRTGFEFGTKPTNNPASTPAWHPARAFSDATSARHRFSTHIYCSTNSHYHIPALLCPS